MDSKKNFKDIKLKILEKEITFPDFVKYIHKGNEYIKRIQNISEKLTARKVIENSSNVKYIEIIDSQLIETINKKNN